MGKTVTWFDTSSDERAAWEAVCPVGQFRVASPSIIPSIMPWFPAGFLAKIEAVTIVASGNVNGPILFMANFHRRDFRARAIDQEPFGAVFLGSEPAPSGCLLHHGAWPGRTVTMPLQFWLPSGATSCCTVSGIPPQVSGVIADLKIECHHAAFVELDRRLRPFIEPYL